MARGAAAAGLRPPGGRRRHPRAAGRRHHLQPGPPAGGRGGRAAVGGGAGRRVGCASARPAPTSPAPPSAWPGRSPGGTRCCAAGTTAGTTGTSSVTDRRRGIPEGDRGPDQHLRLQRPGVGRGGAGRRHRRRDPGADGVRAPGARASWRGWPSCAAAAGALLIFDEMWTGFRAALGGAQERFGVKADLACFSKAIANGMPLAALTGRADVMRLLDRDVFFFTTFGGEALSLAAAKATIGYLNDHAVPRGAGRQGRTAEDCATSGWRPSWTWTSPAAWAWAAARWSASSRKGAGHRRRPAGDEVAGAAGAGPARGAVAGLPQPQLRPRRGGHRPPVRRLP